MTMDSLIGGGSDALEAGYDYTTTDGTTITASSSANTLGSYVELVSAANNDRPINRIIVQCYPDTSVGQGEIMVNIAIGAAASEEIIIPNLFLPTSPTGGNIAMYTFDFPIEIPSGVRISAAVQSSTSNETFVVALILMRGALSQSTGLSTVDSIGANTSTTDGVKVDTSGCNNASGMLDTAS